MQITNNFSLEEFTRSQTAARNDIDMIPPVHVLVNINDLMINFLQPIRDKADSPLIITSGYRPPELNKLIGGSRTSAHMDGRAVDFTIIGQTPFETCEMIKRMGLPFDQLIYEMKSWVHFGISASSREQLLTATRVDGAVVYRAGLFA